MDVSNVNECICIIFKISYPDQEPSILFPSICQYFKDIKVLCSYKLDEVPLVYRKDNP